MGSGSEIQRAFTAGFPVSSLGGGGGCVGIFWNSPMFGKVHVQQILISERIRDLSK